MYTELEKVDPTHDSDAIKLKFTDQQAKTKAERGMIVADIALKSIKFGMLIQIM